MNEVLVSSGFRSAVDWATLVSAAVALLGLVAAFGLGTARVQLLLLRLVRHHTIGRALRDLAVGRFRRRALVQQIRARVSYWMRFDQATRTLLTRRLGAGTPRVVDEFSWLAEVLGAEGTEDWEAGRRQVALPLPFAPEFQGTGRAGLDVLARAYGEYAAAVRRRWLLRAAAGPLATEEFTCARSSAKRLAELARQQLMEDNSRTATPLLEWIDLRIDNTHPEALRQQTRLLAWPIRQRRW